MHLYHYKMIRTNIRHYGEECVYCTYIRWLFLFFNICYKLHNGAISIKGVWDEVQKTQELVSNMTELLDKKNCCLSITF